MRLKKRTPFQRTGIEPYLTTARTMYIDVCPAELVKRFGYPDPGDGYHSSGYYFFCSAKTLDTFIVLDWNATTLYNSILTDPLIFWRGLARAMLMVQYEAAAHSEAVRFKSWVERFFGPPILEGVHHESNEHSTTREIVN